MRRLTILKYYAGYLTALVTFVIYMFCMLNYTQMDLLEIIVTYAVFIYVPSVALPFLIAGEDE